MKTSRPLALYVVMTSSMFNTFESRFKSLKSMLCQMDVVRAAFGSITDAVLYRCGTQPKSCNTAQLAIRSPSKDKPEISHRFNVKVCSKHPSKGLLWTATRCDATRREISGDFERIPRGVTFIYLLHFPFNLFTVPVKNCHRQCMIATVVQISPCTATLIVNSLNGLIRAKEYNFKATTQNTHMLVIPTKTLLYVVN